jgi:hypothetical protein
MGQIYIYPSAGSNPSIGSNGVTAPTSSSEVGFINALGNLTPVSTTNPLPVDATLTLPNPLPVTGPLTDVQLRATAVPVSAAALPLPSGAATSALQTAGNLSLANIDTKLTSPLAVTGPLTDAQLRLTPVSVSISSGIANPLPVTGPLTDTQLRATAVPISGTVTSNIGTTNGLALDTSVNSLLKPASTLAAVTTVTTVSAVTAITNALPVGANVIGKVGIDQTTPGTTNRVDIGTNGTVAINAAIPAGTNLIGSVSAATKGLVVANPPVYNDYSITSVTTAAYVQLIAATSLVTNHVSIFDSSGQAMIFSVGAAAAEVIQLYVPPGGGEFDLAIPAGSRVAIKALTANATSGYILVNLLG